MFLLSASISQHEARRTCATPKQPLTRLCWQVYLFCGSRWWCGEAELSGFSYSLFHKWSWLGHSKFISVSDIRRFRQTCYLLEISRKTHTGSCLLSWSELRVIHKIERNEGQAVPILGIILIPCRRRSNTTSGAFSSLAHIKSKSQPTEEFKRSCDMRFRSSVSDKEFMRKINDYPIYLSSSGTH